MKIAERFRAGFTVIMRMSPEADDRNATKIDYRDLFSSFVPAGTFG
jgi:hypothetical protein